MVDGYLARRLHAESKTGAVLDSMADIATFAGKVHALVYRNWQNRVKGRDWYDFEWYVANKVPLDFAHLQTRIQEFNGMELTKEEFISALKEHVASTDIDQVKQDVIRFLRTDPHSLDIWSKDYFLQLADMIVYKE